MFSAKKIFPRLTGWILLHVYLEGYGGRRFPRRLRWMIAGSEIHRAWVLGSKGFFEQDGEKYSPARPYSIC